MNNKPIKPIRPSKPYPPNKDQKVHKHSINVFDLFIKDVYYDDNGNKIEEHLATEDSNYETEEFTPSIKDLLAALPKDITNENIFIELDLGYDSGRNYVCRPMNGINIYYTTLYDYDKELFDYQTKLKSYDKDILKYNTDMIQYKKELEQYQVGKKTQLLKKKKEELEAQLLSLKGKI